MTPNQITEAQVLLHRYAYLKEFFEMPKNSSLIISQQGSSLKLKVDRDDLAALAEIMLPKVEAALRALGVKIQ